MQRTTRMRTLLRRFAVVLAAVLIAPAAVEAGIGNDLRLSLVATSLHAPQAPPDLRIEATWPDSCLPFVERATVVPGHIDIHLRAPPGRCLKQASTLDLRTNPARASGWESLPLDVYAVRLFLAGADGSETLIAFQWLDAAGQSAATPESGFWWSVATDRDTPPALAGGGISLERQGARIAVTLFGYDAGRPEWAFGSGVLRGSVAHVQLMRMRGDTAAFGSGVATPVADAGPVLHLHFSSPARAQAWIERDFAGGAPGIDLQPLELARSAFAIDRPGSAWQGRWVLVDTARRAARVIVLDATRTSDADGFRLLDAAGGAELDCRIEIGSDAFPRQCTLRIDGEVAAGFDRIGLDRLQGRNTDGETAELIRLPE